jgi:hypothetical protein
VSEWIDFDLNINQQRRKNKFEKLMLLVPNKSFPSKFSNVELVLKSQKMNAK